ncbi:MAG: hypothetical protein QNJ41_13635, partial [Xenococcaceae cyanobacterium MO_188.B32]|nr:hypothetical protein [Xenococcaceae cyanobacterium MO_188.B32]
SGLESVKVLLAKIPEFKPTAVKSKEELRESSGLTYQVVWNLPFTTPSKSPTPPSVTNQGSCPPPVLGVPSLCKT